METQNKGSSKKKKKKDYKWYMILFLISDEFSIPIMNKWYLQGQTNNHKDGVFFSPPILKLVDKIIHFHWWGILLNRILSRPSFFKKNKK